MSKSVPLEQLVALNDEIVALVRAGVPLELGLAEFGTGVPGKLGALSTDLAAKMTGGASITEAFDALGDRVPTVYRTVVEAGVRAGRLSAALEAMSNFGRELLELRRRIGSALLYPLIVIGLAYGLFVVFLVDMIHRLKETYELFRLPIHGTLRAAIDVSESVQYWWWVFPVLFVAALVWWSATGGAHALGFTGLARPLLWIPGVARICRYYQFANYAELLALLIEHQVPLPEGMRLAGDASGDPQLRRSTQWLADDVERGEIFRDVTAVRTGLPPFLQWVIVHGARTSSLSRLLRHCSQLYRRRGQQSAAWFRLMFPVAASILIGGGVTLIYGLTLFGPLAGLWRDLGME